MQRNMTSSGETGRIIGPNKLRLKTEDDSLLRAGFVNQTVHETILGVKR